jgi:hypothetical protein
VSAQNNTAVSFPSDFLLAIVSIDRVPEVKLWSARFFVNQLTVLWRIRVPIEFPNRLVLVSLIDAILGELISARDALHKELKDAIRAKGLAPWKREIFEPLAQATDDDNWLDRICRLRNYGLHGSYLPENIRIGGSPSPDLRLVGYETGIVRDADLPEDLRLVCEKMEDLIRLCKERVESAVEDKDRTGDSESRITSGLAGLVDS